MTSNDNPEISPVIYAIARRGADMRAFDGIIADILDRRKLCDAKICITNPDDSPRNFNRLERSISLSSHIIAYN